MQRFDCGQAAEAEQGEFVRYADHLAAMSYKAPANSLEALAENTLDRIAEFFGKCVNDPDFCGFSVDEVADADGKLLSFTLVPCDTVGGEAVRRVGR